MAPIDRTRLIELQQKKAKRQQDNLKGTLDELDMVEAMAKKAPAGTYANILATLRSKRDRQDKAYNSTVEYILAMEAEAKLQKAEGKGK